MRDAARATDNWRVLRTPLGKGSTVTVSEPPATPSEVWQPLTPEELWGATKPSAPVDWNRISRRPMRLPGARGFDHNLKVGTVLLIISLVVSPPIFGFLAAYCGYRSHRAGNPAGQIFVFGAIALTILNITFLVTVLLPLLPN